MAEAVKGLKELDQFIKQFPAKYQRNVLRSALRASANVVAKAAKSHAPEESGDLKRSIKVSTGVRNGIPKATVKAGDKKAFYVHMVEFGTAPHLISATGAVTHTNKRAVVKTLGMKAINRRISKGVLAIGDKILGETVQHPGAAEHPFMRPAMDTSQSDVLLAFGNQARKRLTKSGYETAPVEIADSADEQD